MNQARSRSFALAVAGLLTIATTAGGAMPTAALASAPGAAVTALQVETSSGVVVRTRVGAECAVQGLAGRFDAVVQRAVLASRRIYLVAPVTPKVDEKKQLDELAKALAKDDCVVYAETDEVILLDSRQFHSWGAGAPTDASELAYLTQLASGALKLDEAHQIARGAGQVVAVLDTGADPWHPLLRGRLDPAWDYISDDDDPYDSAEHVDTDRDGVIDSARGHGTFVAGMLSMVAPDARILPARVLDSDGAGTTFVVAEAILDSIDAGATVINLSLGSRGTTKSRVLDDAIKEAEDQGVLVVAAAGNDARDNPTYPASHKKVISVGALVADGSTLAPFSVSGDKVDVAAVGVDLVGPKPRKQFATWSGTSMASPLVAGQLALLRSVDAGLDGKKAIEALNKTARKIDGVKLNHGAVDLLASLERVR